MTTPLAEIDSQKRSRFSAITWRLVLLEKHVHNQLENVLRTTQHHLATALAGTLQLRDDRGFNAHGTGIYAGKKLRLQAGGR
jgi:hypothetical protein